jgi:hypothetical protein
MEWEGFLATDTGTTNNDGTINQKKRIKKYTVYGKQVAVGYYKKVPVGYYTNNAEALPQRLMFILDEPDQLVMETLSKIFDDLYGNISVSKIEIAWDFYTNQVSSLQNWMERHLYLRYNRKAHNKYRNTFYTGDLRKSVKGIRIYPRPKDSATPTYLRFELELHRHIIRKNHIEFPLTMEMLSLDYSRYFNFCTIDYDGLKKTLFRLHKVDQEVINYEATNPFRRYPNALRRQILTDEIDDIEREEVFSKKMEMVKKLYINNYNRFRKNIGEMRWIFDWMGEKQGFNLQSL